MTDKNEYSTFGLKVYQFHSTYTLIKRQDIPLDLPVSNGCSWWSDRGEIGMFTSIQLQIISDPSLYSFCILWFINFICFRWRNEYRKRKNFYWGESVIGFVLFTGINTPLIVFQEEKQVQLVIFTGFTSYQKWVFVYSNRL